LKNDGYFLSLTPAFPRAEAFQDPTHVNIITKRTFPCYFDWETRWASMYGFNGAFIVVLQEWRGPNLLTIMKKVDALEAYNAAYAWDATLEFKAKLRENNIEILKNESGYYSSSFMKNVICRLKELFF
jgi:hypothetical protein